VVWYLRLFLWPFGLAVAYPVAYVTSPADPRFWACLAFLLVAALAVARWARGSAAGIGAAAFSFAFLVPALNLKAFNFHESLIHDRYLYLPSIGLCLLAALGLSRLAARFSDRRSFPALIAAASIPLFALTVRQNLFWKDDVAMVARGEDATHGRNAYLLDVLGAYQMDDRRDSAAAEKAFEEALRIEPDDVTALLDLAAIRKEAGRFPEAQALYEKALGLGAPRATTAADLGTVYLLQGKLAEGEASLSRALESDPENTAARYNLAWAYQKEGRNTDAEREYKETLRRRPESLEAGINLGLVLIAEGKKAEARQEFLRLRALAPGNQTVLENLSSLDAEAPR
jgi:Flp pilus assembly protein TadD